MATFYSAPTCAGYSAAIATPIFNSDNIARGYYANGSNCRLTKTECEAQGLGYTYDANRYACLFPCPDAYLQSSSNPSQCEPRPLLTAIQIYYEVLADAAASCMDKSEAYRKAVEEGGGNPSSVPFPADCPNPYDRQPETDPLNPQDVLPPSPDVPYIPPPPAANVQTDSSGGVGEPRSRLTILSDEIDAHLRVSEYGVMRDSDLAQRLRLHPTLADVEPAYLTELGRLIPNFQWSVSITQDEYDLLTDDLKCVLCTNYNQLYTSPSLIAGCRIHAPTITITRDAPSTSPPTYLRCPEEIRRAACAQKTGYNGGACTYSGGCMGHCDCPQPPPPPAAATYTPSYSNFLTKGGDLQSTLLLAGGGVVGLFVLYEAFKYGLI